MATRKINILRTIRDEALAEVDRIERQIDLAPMGELDDLYEQREEAVAEFRAADNRLATERQRVYNLARDKGMDQLQASALIY